MSKNSEIVVLIPTMDMERVKPLIGMIKANTIVPDQIVLVNNSGTHHEPPYGCYLLNHYGGNIGVNAAWNLGLRSASKRHCGVSILNDDIQIPNNFFSMIMDGFKKNPEAGVICPLTNPSPSAVYEKRFVVMHKREGWAFTIRKELVPKIQLIPKELFIFCGDTWLFHQTKRNGYKWVKDNECIIHHEVGATLRKNRDLRRLMRKEKAICRKLVDGLPLD